MPYGSTFVDIITSSGTLSVTGNVTSSGIITSSAGATYPLVSGTSQATTSGTSIEFASIPTWAKKITIMYSGVSLSGTSNPIIQLGTAPSTYTTSGYLGSATTGAGTSTAMSTGFLISSASAAADTAHGISTLATINGLIWTYSSLIGYSNQAATRFAAGSITMASAIDRIRITTVIGTDTFDAGNINVLYE